MTGPGCRHRIPEALLFGPAYLGVPHCCSWCCPRSGPWCSSWSTRACSACTSGWSSPPTTRVCRFTTPRKASGLGLLPGPRPALSGDHPAGLLPAEAAPPAHRRPRRPAHTITGSHRPGRGTSPRATGTPRQSATHVDASDDSGPEHLPVPSADGGAWATYRCGLRLARRSVATHWGGCEQRGQLSGKRAELLPAVHTGQLVQQPGHDVSLGRGQHAVLSPGRAAFGEPGA